jgi:uncharacterized membrane protein
MSKANAANPTGPYLAHPVSTQPGNARPRLDALDWVRGLVMVLMVLDHTRDFLGGGDFNPRDVNNTPLFLTRWITHFCAPTFVFLAGVSAYLYGQRGRTRAELSGYLLTRGAWLVLAEIVFVRFAWSFRLQTDVLILQVIWAIGVSFIVLSAVIRLPFKGIAVFAILMVAGHNLLDPFTAAKMGSAGWLWLLVHEQGVATLGGKLTLMIIYPVVPWIGVAAGGYCLGPAMLASPSERQRWLLGSGLGLISCFILLRELNFYGDPQPWATQKTALATLLSFLNCEKYPPSLLYLCMTLGPALLLLRAAEKFKSRLASVIITFGRVPFLFYVAHIALLHLIAIGWAQIHDGNSAWLFAARPILSKPPGYGLGLPWVYALWLSAVVMLYPLCYWFAQVKQRRRDWWLSYL